MLRVVLLLVFKENERVNKRSITLKLVVMIYTTEHGRINKPLEDNQTVEDGEEGGRCNAG